MRSDIRARDRAACADLLETVSKLGRGDDYVGALLRLVLAPILDNSAVEHHVEQIIDAGYNDAHLKMPGHREQLETVIANAVAQVDAARRLAYSSDVEWLRRGDGAAARSFAGSRP